MAEELRIENQLNYYRGNRTFKDVLLEEFAFSTIFGNIALDKVQQAIKSVGLKKTPNVFLLIQVDDYSNESKRFSVEDEFVMKVKILSVVRSRLKKDNFEFVAANLTGTDKMIAFLCMEEEGGCDKELLRISEDICEKVHFFINYTVSICISDFCEKITQFPENYKKASAMLQESFFLGKKIQTKVISSSESNERTHIAAEVDQYIQSIYVSLSMGNRVLFGQTMVSFFKTLQEGRRNREQSQILAGKLIDKMGEYVISCGAENEAFIAEKASAYKETIISSYYADDICFAMTEYFEIMREILEEVRGRSPEDAFRETVDQYIRDHFRERIYLDEIAMRCGYSKYYFCRQIKKCLGMGLSERVNQFRIKRAKELLGSGYQSIEDIVRETGFSSANYFEIVFRKSEGMSPSEYRRSLRK